MNNHGRKVCSISGGKYDKRIVSLSKQDDSEEADNSLYREFTYLKLSPDAKFVPIPADEKDLHGQTQRTIGYITGPSGAGKSTQTRSFCENYTKMYPKNKIYLFSKLEDDPSLDGVKNLLRVKIDDQMLDPETRFDAADFKDSMVIFDDTDRIPNKKHLVALNKLKDDIYTNGRHYNTGLINTTHRACGGSSTQTALDESHFITVFLNSGQNYDRLLSHYLDLTKKEIEKVKSFDSRWITIMRGHPQIIFTEHEIMFKKNLLDAK